MKTRKNDPCPCGSGKKYQLCCINKPARSNPLSNQSAKVIPINYNVKYDDQLSGRVKDYGEPEITIEFFENHQQIDSPQGLCYTLLINPEMETLAAILTNKQSQQEKDEAKEIQKTKKLDDLIEMMKQGISYCNARILINKVVEQKSHAVPKILAELRRPQSDIFYQFAVRIIFEADIDCTRELIELTRQPVSNPYGLSLLCLLLGFCNTEAAVKPLWDCYHFFKEKYPQETFAEGPFIALFDLCVEEDGSEDEFDEDFDEDDFDEDFDEEIPVTQVELMELKQLFQDKLKHQLDDVTFEEIKGLIQSEKKMAAVKLYRERTGAGLTEAKEVIESIAKHLTLSEDINNLITVMLGNALNDSEIEFDDEVDEDEVDEEQEKRIKTILGGKTLNVTKKSLKTYADYLKKHLQFPSELTGMDVFDWEEFYVFEGGNKKEYFRLRKTQASYADRYTLLGFADQLDKNDGILVNVERINDKKPFTLPLANLIDIDADSDNYQLLEDYSEWFINY